MPINRDKGVIFVHIPKCAGTSIEKLFGMATREELFTTAGLGHKSVTDESLFAEKWKFEQCAAKNMQHYTFREISAVLSSEVVASYDIFSIVRNPYTRLVSEYEHCKAKHSRYEGWAHIHETSPCRPFADFVNTQLQLADYTRIQNYDGHLETQVSYLINSAGNLESIGTIYRFEDIGTAITKLTDKYKLPKLSKPERIGNYTKNYASYYNPELQHTVKTFYAQDFEMFNYNPDILP